MTKKIIVNKTSADEARLTADLVRAVESVSPGFAKRVMGHDLASTASILTNGLKAPPGKRLGGAIKALALLARIGPAYWFGPNLRPEVVNAVQGLIALLTGVEGVWLPRAIETLGQFGRAISKGGSGAPIHIARAIAVWAKQARDGDTEALYVALRALRECGRDAAAGVIPELQTLLESQHAGVRRRTCELFTWLGQDADVAVPDVLNLVLDDAEVAAVKAQAVRAIVQMLDVAHGDKDKAGQNRAAQASVRRKIRNATTTLREMCGTNTRLKELIDQLRAIGTDGRPLRRALEKKPETNTKQKPAVKKKGKRGRHRDYDHGEVEEAYRAWKKSGERKIVDWVRKYKVVHEDEVEAKAEFYRMAFNSVHHKKTTQRNKSGQ